MSDQTQVNLPRDDAYGNGLTPLPGIRRACFRLIHEIVVGIPDTLSRNLLLAFLVLATLGAVLHLSLFETSLILMLSFIALRVVARLSWTE